MTDHQILSAFADAWRGVRTKDSRFADRYLGDLRRANTPDRRRSLLSELLAEGLIAAHGSAHFSSAEAVMELWRDGESDDWARVRDIALLAAAT